MGEVRGHKPLSLVSGALSVLTPRVTPAPGSLGPFQGPLWWRPAEGEHHNAALSGVGAPVASARLHVQMHCTTGCLFNTALPHQDMLYEHMATSRYVPQQHMPHQPISRCHISDVCHTSTCHIDICHMNRRHTRDVTPTGLIPLFKAKTTAR